MFIQFLFSAGVQGPSSVFYISFFIYIIVYSLIILHIKLPSLLSLFLVFSFFLHSAVGPWIASYSGGISEISMSLGAIT